MGKRENAPQLTNMERRMLARCRAEYGHDFDRPPMKIRDRIDAQRHGWPSEAYDLRCRRLKRQGKL